MPQRTRPAPCSSTVPKNRASDSAQPALSHTGLMTMPCGPCPLQPTSASHLQQQTRGQLQLFPLQHPTLSVPAQLETGAHEHNQEKRFSFRGAKLSRARSNGLGWPLTAMADTRPSPLSYLLPTSCSTQAGSHFHDSPHSPHQKLHQRKGLQIQPHSPRPRSHVTPQLALSKIHWHQILWARQPCSRLAMPKAALQ